MRALRRRHETTGNPVPEADFVLRRVCAGRLRCRAFTLLELLVVAAIISIVLVLVTPVFNQINSGRELHGRAYDIVGALDGARSFAVANKTYVWVGFFEDDPTATAAKPAAAGTGRVVISVVASTDGTRIYTFTTSGVTTTAPEPLDAPGWGSGRLTQVGKLTKLSGIHMPPDLSVLSLPKLGAASIKLAYQVGHTDFARHPASPTGGSLVANPTTFSYPLGSASPDYRFVKIIEFNPRGEAMKIVSDFDGPTAVMGIGVQPARGNFADAKNPNVAAITVSGLTGATRLFRK